MKTNSSESILNINVKHIPIKRLFDLVFSLTMLALCAPLLLLIMLMIRLSSRGKVIYSHERIGRGGKPFHCFKFRTMHSDADARLEALLENNPVLKNEWEQTRKLKQDPRVIPIGYFLRRTSLDELPQLWNVLKGDLSVVGPRPVVHEEIIYYIGSKASKILSVRPGLTCIWQVSGRSDTSYSKRIALDEAYVDNQSFLLDIKLILKTIPSMIFSKGAY
jgi:undecaprenyl-phosphate galactose phosphotransferase